MVTKLQDRTQNPKLVSALSHLAHSYSLAHRPTVTDLKSYKLLKDLRKNKNIVILKPDKGNGVVVLDRTAYDSVILKIISDTSKFKVLAEDSTLLREGQLQRFLRKLKATGQLDADTYSKIYPTGSRPARIYGLPKMHKPRGLYSIPPLRPIVSSIGMYNYELAKYLCCLLQPHIPFNYCTQDSFTFVGEIQKLRLSGNFMVSFDAESLFTNIPLNECIDLAVKYVSEGNPDLKLSTNELKNLFHFATSRTHFLLKRDGVAMGSPLAPVLANLFMGHHENIWLETYRVSKISFYRRYVDDTFFVFETEQDALLFFDFINTRHPNIRFTMEKEVDHKLPFLDVFIHNHSPGPPTTTVFRKKTFTGLLTNYFHCFIVQNWPC